MTDSFHTNYPETNSLSCLLPEKTTIKPDQPISAHLTACKQILTVRNSHQDAVFRIDLQTFSTDEILNIQKVALSPNTLKIKEEEVKIKIKINQKVPRRRSSTRGRLPGSMRTPRQKQEMSCLSISYQLDSTINSTTESVSLSQSLRIRHQFHTQFSLRGKSAGPG